MISETSSMSSNKEGMTSNDEDEVLEITYESDNQGSADGDDAEDDEDDDDSEDDNDSEDDEDSATDVAVDDGELTGCSKYNGQRK